MDLHGKHRNRMMSRLASTGGFGLDEPQVLEMLLYSVNTRCDTAPIALRLLERFGNLSAVLDADISELIEVKGIGEKSASMLKIVQLASDFYNNDVPSRTVALHSTADIGNFVTPRFYSESTEVVYMLCMNDERVVQNLCKICDGEFSASEVEVRKIVTEAVRNDASYVVLAHNHPSGVALPSGNDYDSTVSIQNALDIVGINLLDHIVVSTDDWTSMSDSRII